MRRVAPYLGVFVGAALVALVRQRDEAVVVCGVAYVVLVILLRWARAMSLDMRLPLVLAAGYEFAVWFHSVVIDEPLESSYSNTWALWMVVAPVAAFAFYVALRWSLKPR